jgi:hypothetical protein
MLLKLQKYHRERPSGRGGDTGAFTHRSIIVVANKRGQVWLPQRLSNKAKRSLDSLDVDGRRDFYARFRAIAGLPDEWRARQNNHPVDAQLLRIFIEGLTGDETNAQTLTEVTRQNGSGSEPG